VRVFIVPNSVLFTMVRYISQHGGMIRESELADELTRMVASYIAEPPASEETVR